MNSALVPQLRLPTLKSVLLSTHFITAIVASIISALLFLIASAASSVQLSAPAPDPALQAIATAQSNLNNTLFQVQEERRRDDFAALARNYGDLQALLQHRAIAIQQEVGRQIADPKHENFGKTSDEVYQSLRKRSMDLLVNASNNTGGSLKSVDPNTGKIFESEVRDSELAAVAILRLEAINYAQHSKLNQSVDLNAVRKNIASQENQLKNAQAVVLDSTGQGQVANRLRAKDVYGNSINDPYTPFPGGM